MVYFYISLKVRSQIMQNVKHWDCLFVACGKNMYLALCQPPWRQYYVVIETNQKSSLSLYYKKSSQ